MSNDHFKRAEIPLELDTLPDFMKSTSQQVKFHSAFPPLSTKVRVRSVMERAGFDVYKPEKDASISSSSRTPTFDDGKFRPPNKFFNSNHSSRSLNSNSSDKNQQMRSFSHNAISMNSTSSLPHNGLENPKNVFQKSRNFTTNNSTPNLNSHNLSGSPQASTYSPTNDSTVSKKKNNILNYARQKLNVSLHTSKQNTAIPISTELPESFGDDLTKPVPALIVPDLSLPSTANNTIDNEITYNDTNALTESISKNAITYENNEFKSSTLLPHRQIPHINGPRPYSETESDSELEDEAQNKSKLNVIYDEANYASLNDHQHEVPFPKNSRDSNDNYIPTTTSIITTSQASTTNTNELDTQLVDSESSLPATNNEFNSNRLHITEVSKSSRFSTSSSKSASSVESFDKRFMFQTDQNNVDNEDSINDLSQETLAGLSGMRDVFRVNDSSTLTPLVPNLTSPYDDKTKRISTLGMSDMRIYNLQSLDNESNKLDDQNQDFNQNQYDQLNKDMNEMSIIQEGDIEDSRMIDNNSIAENVYETSKDINIPTIIQPEYSNCDEETKENYSKLELQEDDEKDLGDDEIFPRGFTRRTANAVDSPNSFSVPVLPESTPEIKLQHDTSDDISHMINDIENFQNGNGEQNFDETSVEDDTQDFEIPPRHFERSNKFYQHHDQENNNQIPTVSRTNTLSAHHPYASLSHNSYSASMESSPQPGFSSGFTTPEKDEFNNNLVPAKKNIYHPPGEGPCRKCEGIIHDSEKKIWSKDHQLSGQWHRSCFGCQTCGQKFSKGSSCYVYEDQPYCEIHFHNLNGSLCQVCSKGVEGECLQNEINEVFHIDCLKCVICGLNVEGDYFIFRDEVMCENDAKELLYQIEEAEKEYKNKDTDKIIKRRTRVLYV